MPGIHARDTLQSARPKRPKLRAPKVRQLLGAPAHSRHRGPNRAAHSRFSVEVLQAWLSNDMPRPATYPGPVTVLQHIIMAWKDLGITAAWLSAICAQIHAVNC